MRERIWDRNNWKTRRLECSYMCMEAMDNFFITVTLLTAHFTSGRSSEDCIPKQIMRPGESGTIRCSIEDGYFGVYWYDTQDLTQQPVLFSEDGQIGGHGYTSGEFNLISGGSLLIVQVAAKHERIYTVVILENRDSDKLIQHTIEVSVIALPSLPYPDIKQCESKQYCYKKINAGDELECAVHDARPPVHLTWVQRTMNHDSDVTFQRTYSTNVDLNTTTATMRLRSLLHFHFHLFVCRAKYNTLVLDSLESFIITELDEPSTDLSKATYKEIEKGDSIILQCSGDKMLFFIWKKTVPGTANVVIAHGYVLAGTNFSIQPYSIDRYGSLTFLQFNESQEGVYACYTSDGNKETVTSYNLMTVSLVTQPIVTSGTGITEIAAKQRNKAAVVIAICLPLFGTLVVLVLVIAFYCKKSIQCREEKNNQEEKENVSLMINKNIAHDKDGSKDSVEKDARDTTEVVTMEREDSSNNPENIPLMIKKNSGHEKDGSKDSVEKDARDTTEVVTVEIEDSSNNPENFPLMIKKNSGHEKDGSKDSVEKDARDTTEGVTVEIEDSSNNPETFPLMTENNSGHVKDGSKDSVERDATDTMDAVTVEMDDSSKHPVTANNRDHEKDGRKDLVEIGLHVKHQELSEGEANEKSFVLSNVTFNKDGNPSICKDGSILRSGEIIIQKFCVGARTIERATKVILVLSESGAGKPEVVTNLVNYLITFKWNNESRNELLIDPLQQSRSKNPSIIHWINIFQCHNDLPFDIAIVDLPESIETSKTTAVIRYKQVANIIHQLTEGDEELRLEQVNAVLIVQKYSPQTETPNTLRTILAKNLKSNIFNFLTFSLEEFDKVDLIENAIITSFVGNLALTNCYFMPLLIGNAHNTSNRDNFRDKAINHFAEFLNFLKHCHQIELSKMSEVLENRSNLEKLLTQIQSKIAYWRNQERGICKAKSTLADIEDKNKGSVKVPLIKGERAVNCQICKTTCHYPCNHYLVRTCSCMKWLSDARGCSVCKKNCAPSHHTQDSFKYKTIKDKEDEIKQHKGRVDKAETDLKAAKGDVQKQAREINVCLQNLSIKAIKPTVLSIEGDLIKETVSKAMKWDDFSQEIDNFLKMQ
ncbi:uncharacterized protein [Apostichopus japonicus]|uniref:uncharacterized protein isoform X2 n=1 Tax=Stichopus japonicus TaxID=307972 RepID=UPI003AB47D2D